jgi:hypothetical protein
MAYFWYPFIKYSGNYSYKDLSYIATAFTTICNHVMKEVKNFTKPEEIFKEMYTEAVGVRTQELIDYNAIGLAWVDGNTTYIPPGIDRFQISLRTSILSMEITHSIVGRITKNNKKMNDVIHYLYNANKLKNINTGGWVANVLGLGTKIVFPELEWGMVHQDWIIEEIRKGTAPGGVNEYWTTTNNNSAMTVADEHELEMTKQFLLTGSTAHH